MRYFLRDLNSHHYFHWPRIRWWNRHPVVIGFVWASLRLQRFLGADGVTDADPFKVIWVSAASIEMTCEGVRSRWGIVMDALPEMKPLAQKDKYPFRRDVLSNWLAREGESGFEEGLDPAARGVIEEFRALMGSVRKQGMRPMRLMRPWTHWLPLHYRDFDIGVNIGPEGELCWAGWGMHRLMCAKVLGLESIPVQVHARHRTWQERRDRIRSAKSISDIAVEDQAFMAHPDVSDIMPPHLRVEW